MDLDESTEFILEKSRRRRLQLDEISSDSGELSSDNGTTGVKRKSLDPPISAEEYKAVCAKKPSFDERDKKRPSLYPVSELETIRKEVEEEAKENLPEERPSVKPESRKARLAALAAQFDEFEDDTRSIKSGSVDSPKSSTPNTPSNTIARKPWGGETAPEEKPKVPEPSKQSGIESFYREKATTTPSPKPTPEKRVHPEKSYGEPIAKETATVKWPKVGSGVAAKAAIFESGGGSMPKPKGWGLAKKEPFPSSVKGYTATQSPKRQETLAESEEDVKARIRNLRSRWELSSATGTPLHPESGNDDLVNAAVSLAKLQNRRAANQPWNQKKPTATPAPQPEPEKEEEEETEPESSEDTEEDESHEIEEEEEEEEEVFEDSGSLNEALNECLDIALNSKEKEEKKPEVKEEEPPRTPLVHSVSFFRSQERIRKEKSATPVVVKLSTTVESPAKSLRKEEERQRYEPCFEELVKALNEKVGIQQDQIKQASRALDLCRTKPEFRGSREEVVAQKALLLATEGRKASLAELDHLRKVRKERQGLPLGKSVGTLTISKVSIPLKREFVNNNCNHVGDLLYYFIGIFKFQDSIHATQMVSSDEALKKGSKLEFPNYINLNGLPPGFAVRFEVYALRTKREGFSHEEKYRLKGAGTLKGKKASSMFTQSISSPGGPAAILDPSFQQIAEMELTLESVKKRQFYLNGVKGLQITSPLEDNVSMHLRCVSEESSTVEERGFLSAFEEISNLGSWTRLWCVLKDGRMSFWRYPDDELIREPLNIVDLRACLNKVVGLVSLEVCARPNTFSLDVDVDEGGQRQTFRIMLSADGKEDCLRWCGYVNETLQNLRSWNPSSSH